MPKFFSKIIRKILHRAKKGVISAPCDEENDVFASPGQPPAEDIVEEVKLVRHQTFMSSKRERSMSNAVSRIKPSRRMSTPEELDHQLALMRRSRIVPVRESFSLSASSTDSRETEYEDCPVFLVSFDFLGVV
ncbi:hypothetical protein FO519_010100 [Halicephalobus sp. NKZ332]|nr:hypothetical protein FO519_010100 [Halicephalobus sp. NKZ332]